MNDQSHPNPPDVRADFRRSHRFRLFWRRLRLGRRALSGPDVRNTIGQLIDTAPPQQDSIAPHERRLLKNILALHERTVRDVMVPRVDIIAVEAETSLAGIIKVMTKESHSRVPIYREKLDSIVGMLHVKDLLPYWNARKGFKLGTVLRKVLFAAPSMRVLDLLAQMRDTRIHLALVVDEFGGIDGLVTIEDLVEEIVGDIADEHDDQEVAALEDEPAGTMIADARLRLEALEHRIGRWLSDDERANVDTLGGLVVYLAGRVPARGELVKHDSGIEFEVLDADPRRVRRVRLRNVPTPAPEHQTGK
ncbi:MAG: hemolysin family protein [Alphaproteobacteria bacterium]